jgi:hypothetical protein
MSTLGGQKSSNFGARKSTQKRAKKCQNRGGQKVGQN